MSILASNKSSSKVFETLKISSKNDIQNDHEKETIQQMKESVNVICMVYIVGVIDYSPQNYKREYNGGDGISVLQPNAMLTINKAVAQQAIGFSTKMHTQLDMDSSHQILEQIKLDDLTEKAWYVCYFELCNKCILTITQTILSVYFVDSDSSVEDYCVDVTVDFLISYDINDKIVAFHVQEVSKLLSRNTFDLDEIFNEDPPKPIYFEDSDILIVSLVYSTLPSRFLKTEIEDIKVRTDNVGNIICLSFYSASNRIAEELTLEEKENHKKKSKKKSERLLNWSKSIIHEYNM
ncbi:hypothetical protein RhiirA5_431311 [Rhizophagus irregularis]|uniref:Uncharacterized protein n=1 Tax=Rhizophagus irregularis TaxID=588596 RepID=A0A2N0NV79_9GLOM|nr:hypothetical protein RhiirA5_431311 [Rhizophagus irregularis]